MNWKTLTLSSLAFFLMLGLVVYAFMHGGELSLLNPKGPIGIAERKVIEATVYLSLLVLIPVFILLFTFAIRYRATKANAHEKHAPNWDHDNWIAEAVWWTIPSIIVVILAVIAWKSSHDLDPYTPLQSSVPALTIEVVALDWKWLFIYPDQGIATVNMVTFPENTPIIFHLTADAPMNGFWIPSLGSQIMVMPGMETKLNLLAHETGVFNGVSSNISGKGFAGMTFKAHSVTRAEFDAWVSESKEKDNPLTSESFTELAKPSEYVPVTTYSEIPRDLFLTVIMKFMVSTPTTPATTHNTSMKGMDMSQH